MSPDERRRQIIERLAVRKHDTMQHLADEFGVSWFTIYRDIQKLSLTYPIFTSRGNNGGITVLDSINRHRRYLTAEQRSLLEKVKPSLPENEQAIIQSILWDFAPGDAV